MSGSFNLEAAISAWRRPLEHMRSVSVDDLRELESGLRDSIDDMVADGMPVETAFRRAVRDLDDPFEIEQEYRKVFWKKSVHRHTIASEFNHHAAMLRNYLMTGLRSMSRQKGYSFINIAGLAFGLAACILLLLFIREELSFDTFQQHGDRIYRVVQSQDDASMAYQSSLLGPIMEREIPAVEATVRFRKIDEVSIGAEGEPVQTAPGFLYVDAAFFQVFSFVLERGDPLHALDKPWSVVLTRSQAENYFPGQDPMGALLPVHGGEPFTVTGIVADPPAASSIQFGFLASMSTLDVHPSEQGMFRSGWGASAYPTYVMLDVSASAGVVESILPAILAAQTDAEYILEADFTLEPLKDHHFSAVSGALAETSDIRFLFVFSTIAALILGIACVNYINLSTARASLRAREIGIRKVVGADRGMLRRQFLGESMMTAILALVIGLGLVVAAVGPFASLVDRSIDVRDLADGPLLASIGLMLILVGLLAGSWPAAVLSRFHPTQVLKGQSGASTSGNMLRRVLVVFQFSISIVLIISTITIHRQLGFIQEKDLGLAADRVVSLSLRGPLRAQADVFAERLSHVPNIAGVSLSGGIPTRGTVRFAFTMNDEQRFAPVFPVDTDFMDTMEMTLVSGRGFSPDINDASGKTAVGGAIVNETMAALLGFEDPVGQMLPLTPNGSTYRIVGVVKDFHMTSLHEPIAPMVLAPLEDYWTRWASVRVTGTDYRRVLGDLETVWNELAPEEPFTYLFLDDAFDQLYKGPYQLARLFDTFSLVAIVVACLGLFGLAAFSTVRRTREIGLRKALGSSRRGILVLFSREFLLLILVAYALATPVAWLVMQKWLDTFAYRTEVDAASLLVSGLLMAFVALATVGWQSFRAASINPTEALRHV